MTQIQQPASTMTQSDYIAIVACIITVIPAIIAIFYAKKQTKLANLQIDIAQKETIRTEKLFSKDDQILENVSEVIEKITQVLIDESLSVDTLSIDNYGLDLETVMPWVKNKLLASEKLNSVKLVYRGLLANNESVLLKSLIDGSSSIQSSYIQASIESAISLKNEPIKQSEIEIRVYDTPPVFHGFIINKRHLFISFTEITNGKIRGGSFPYIYMNLNRASKLNLHYFGMFNSWFDYTWEKSILRTKIS